LLPLANLAVQAQTELDLVIILDEALDPVLNLVAVIAQLALKDEHRLEADLVPVFLVCREIARNFFQEKYPHGNFCCVHIFLL
jgi:hypothetical protein